MAFDLRYKLVTYCEKMNAKNVSQVIKTQFGHPQVVHGHPLRQWRDH